MSKFAVFLPVLLLVACGGSSKPADAPKSEDTSAESAPKDKPADEKPADSDEDKSDAKADKKDDAKKSDAPTDDSSKPKKSAQDVLTAPDTVFEISFNDSDVKQTAETKCTASSGNDQKKMNACMSKARQALDVDGYQFKSKDGKVWWLWLRTRGKHILVLHKYEVDFADDKGDSVVVKAKGKDMGSAPGHTPGATTIQIPNDYQISVTDPKLGKLVYSAKIGTQAP
ncbi:MAG TPA: hypothetical protein VGM44_01750 [Polyangiaceae bacterium]|jgi:hypothetical protein